jgi:hypothetical protein
MGHHGPNFKLGRVWHTPPLKGPNVLIGPTYPQSGKQWPETFPLSICDRTSTADTCVTLCTPQGLHAQWTPCSHPWLARPHDCEGRLRHMCHVVHPAEPIRTMNPMFAPLTRTCPWLRRSAPILFVTPQSPNGSYPFCTLSEPHLPPSHLRFCPRFA